jgi:alpha-tubulin suppressor-like RCC1 family protein
MVLQVTPAQAAERIVQISAGNDHTCALTMGGGVKCWGFNEHGELGDGTTTDSTDPVDVVGLSSGATFISAGAHDTCAVTTEGAVKCWGYNGSGELGDGSGNNSSTPVDVSGLSSGVVTVSTGVIHTCAVTTEGGVKCWGDNHFGAFGDGTGANSTTPVDVPELSSGVAAVSGGSYMGCALTTGGAVKCSGINTVGQLGDGTTTDSLTPVNVSGLSSGVADVSTGYGHTCAVTIEGGVKCWGVGTSGQLGNGTTTDSTTPVDVSGLASGTATISSGSYASCAVTTGGGVKCWGLNQYYPSLTSTTPFDLSGLTSGVESVSVGDNHGCALMTWGGVKCWGWNGHGQLGDGTTTDSTDPVDAIAVPSHYDLNVTRTGTGSGAVVSSPAGIDCPDTCATSFESSASVTLTAASNATSVFMGWSGSGCSGTGTCSVTMDQARSVSASFAKAYRPDGRISVPKKLAQVGNNIYDRTGARQTASIRLREGRSAVFVLKMQNDGALMDSFLVTGPGSSWRFSAKYLLNTQNVTKKVTSGGVRLTGVAPGAIRTIRLVVTVRVGGGVTRSWRVFVTSRHAEAADVVRARVRGL